VLPYHYEIFVSIGLPQLFVIFFNKAITCPKLRRDLFPSAHHLPSVEVLGAVE
jgi:hypothetical protein